MNRILRCPDCNTPLVPGSMSCIKCNKQFSKPIPKVAEPETDLSRNTPTAMNNPTAILPAATPAKSIFKTQSKVLIGTALTLVCLIALVIFVVSQSQENKRMAFAAEQVHQQALRNQAQLQQAPAPVPTSTPMVLTPALKRNNFDWSKVDRGLANSTNGASSNGNNAQLSPAGNEQQTQNSQADSTDQQVAQYYSDGQAAYQEGINSQQTDTSGYVTKINSDAESIKGLQSSARDSTTATNYALKATELGTMADQLTNKETRRLMPAGQDPGAITSLP